MKQKQCHLHDLYVFSITFSNIFRGVSLTFWRKQRYKCSSVRELSVQIQSFAKAYKESSSVKFPDVGGQFVALKPKITHFLNFLNPVVLQPFFAYFAGVLRVAVLLKPPLRWLFILCIGHYYVLQYIKIHKSIDNAINMMNWPHSLTRKTVSDHYTSTAMFDCCVAIHEI